MALLTAILTHLDARLVEKQLSYLRAIAPGARFVICHGGTRADFDALEAPGALFIEDPSLRGPHFEQSLNGTLRAVYENLVRDDETIEHVYVIEYDHLILRGDFEQTLADLAERTGAGLLAKWASPRNDTNWSHYLRARKDAELNAFIAGISRRHDPGVRFGCLGTGLLFRRDAFSAFCMLDDPPSRYFELFVPTVIHHLGFEVVDVDAVADLYTAIRWLPEFDGAGAAAEQRAGRTFVHPFKQIDSVDAIRAAQD
jgi:hypothetical protein